MLWDPSGCVARFLLPSAAEGQDGPGGAPWLSPTAGAGPVELPPSVRAMGGGAMVSLTWVCMQASCCAMEGHHAPTHRALAGVIYSTARSSAQPLHSSHIPYQRSVPARCHRLLFPWVGHFQATGNKVFGVIC